MCNMLSTLVLLLKKSCSSSGLDFGLLRDFQNARARAPSLSGGCAEAAERLLPPDATPRRCRRFYPLVRPSVVTAATTEPTAAASSSLSAQPPSIVSLCFSLSLLRSPIPHKIGRLGKREATARRACGTPPLPPLNRRLCVLCRRHLSAPRSSEGHRRRTAACRRAAAAAPLPMPP